MSWFIIDIYSVTKNNIEQEQIKEKTKKFNNVSEKWEEVYYYNTYNVCQEIAYHYKNKFREFLICYNGYDFNITNPNDIYDYIKMKIEVSKEKGRESEVFVGPDYIIYLNSYLTD